MLGRAKGYIETKIGCESETERRYRVQDFWVWHRSFEAFRETFAADYEKFEWLLVAEGLIERERFVGAYYEKAPGDEDELVSG